MLCIDGGLIPNKRYLDVFMSGVKGLIEDIKLRLLGKLITLYPTGVKRSIIWSKFEIVNFISLYQTAIFANHKPKDRPLNKMHKVKIGYRKIEILKGQLKPINIKIINIKIIRNSNKHEIAQTIGKIMLGTPVEITNFLYDKIDEVDLVITFANNSHGSSPENTIKG